MTGGNGGMIDRKVVLGVAAKMVYPKV
jgi:hypothetical protein